jgi:hypothetical protein
MKSLLQTIAIRHPYALATVLFIAVMTAVKLGAKEIVNSYGAIGALVTIAIIYFIATLMDRRGT